MSRCLWSCLIALCLFPSGDLLAQKKNSSEELKLEDIYPKKSFFGPSARSPEFSADGRYGTYLYHTNEERRHGMDLWVYDFKTKKQTRVTSVAMMSEFQKSARKVKEDRLAKAKKAAAKEEEKKDDSKDAAKTSKKKKAAKKSAGKRTQQEIDDELKIINTAGDKDADDEKAPRYSGISSVVWHPTKNSLLLVSEGDIYEIDNIDKPKLRRLTKTQASEGRVQYLPDGSGYTYQNSDVVYRVRFKDHFIEQINSGLSGGQRLTSYEISPDGKRLLMVAQTGRRMDSDHRVDIIRYRDRFAKSDSVSRTVSDDAMKPQDVFVYLYELDSANTESASLIKVFETKIDEPRDVISSPKWSLDSEKVTFCFFDQKNSEVQILLAGFPEKKTEKAEGKSGDADKSKDESAEKKAKEGEQTDHPARTVYRFKHDGGPNTPRMVSPDFAWDARHIVFVSEQTGFRHVHLLDSLYESVRVLTSGNFEVYPFGMSKDHQRLYVTSTKDSSAREMVYSLELESGELKKLSKNDGTYSSVAVSNDGDRMLANYVTYGKLTELVVQDRQKPKTITDSHPEKAHQLTSSEPEFFDYENRHGHKISGMVFKPDGWKKSKKVPLLIYVYGGPLGTRKSVSDGSYSSAGYFFNNYMAKKHGYITVVIDPRGQSGYGGLFEKSNYEQVGKPQVEDLVDGVEYLAESFNIDQSKVGVYGWSFGGFQTQMCLYTEPDVFQVGIAGAGPTEWENYNAWYTTGTIGPSKTGTPDQKKYSLRPLAKNLKGKLLLIHGMEDTNVLFQDTVAIYRELLQAGKEVNVELFLDPTGSHGLGGDVKRLNQYRKYEDFLLRTLGEGK